MIHILHGEDTEASYNRLSQILSSYPNHIKVRLTNKDNSEDFYLAIFSSDFFQVEKIVICENFLQLNLLNLKDLDKIPKDCSLIFWEHTQIPLSIISKLRNFAIIENFKPKSDIFLFLDLISPNGVNLSQQFIKLKTLQDSNLIWHLTYRTLLLILAKQAVGKNETSKFLEKTIADWQWEKVIKQSRFFTLQKLFALYNGLIKLDFRLKSGLTTLKDIDLVPLLLLKYLRS